MIRLAAQENLLPGRGLEEKFDFAQSVGFDGTELIGHGGFAERVDEVRSARAAGVLMPTVCARLDHFIGDFEPAPRREAREQTKTMLLVIPAAAARSYVLAPAAPLAQSGVAPQGL
jgi:sugar phosphate isomerase/epimerase